MSFLSDQLNAGITQVALMHWNTYGVDVSARPFHALVFRLKGKASFSCGEQKKETSEGDVIYMPAGLPYSATYTDANEIIAIHFESDIGERKIENYTFRNYHAVQNLFFEILDIWKKKEPGYYYSAMSIFYQILEKLSASETSPSDTQTGRLFAEAINYMEENFLSPDFSVDEMVKKSCMSNTYFRKFFKERYALTPIAYVTAKRIEYADRLLSKCKYSVKEVAEKCGFEDEKYFSRVIKNHYGVSPSKLYRVKKHH